METFVKWFVESMSLVRFVSVFMLTALCYVFAPDVLNVRLAAASPEFMPSGTLRFVLFFCGSFLSVFAAAKLCSLFFLPLRETWRKKRIENILLNLNEDEELHLFLWAEGGFREHYSEPPEAFVLSLLKKGIVGRVQYRRYSFYVLPEVQTVLEDWLLTERAWVGELRRMTRQTGSL